MFRIFNSSAFGTLTRRVPLLLFAPFMYTVFYSTSGLRVPYWHNWQSSTPPARKHFYVNLPSIYSGDFIELLINLIKRILELTPYDAFFLNIIMEAELHAGINRTVGKGLRVEKNTDLSTLIPLITEYIEAFETQSGTPEERQQEEVLSTRIQVFIRTNLNYDGNLQTPIGAKEFVSTSRKGALSNTQLLAEIAQLQTQSTERLVQAIKSTQPSLLSGINWTPIVQGLTNVVITSLGGQPVSFPTSPTAPAAKTAAQTTSGEVQNVQPNLAPILERINLIETKFSSLEASLVTLTSTVNNLAHNTNSQISQNNAQINELVQGQKAVNTKLETLVELLSQKAPQNNNESNGGGSSSAPTSLVPNTITGNVIKSKNGTKTTIINSSQEEIFSPISGAGHPSTEQLIKNMGFDPFSPPPENNNSPLSAMQEIEELVPTKKTPDLKNNIVAADLEALITPKGENVVYMAAWYNGSDHKIFDISQWGYNTETMLSLFWQDLINQNRGRTVYFHNFGGYDAILSLPALLNLPFSFKPIMKDGEIISIKVLGKRNRLLLTIKDSIRILPGSLSKLAKDWGAETQKDHFPHYFFLDDIKTTLDYEGAIPEYKYFESKRTSPKDYEEMKELFSNRVWSFLKVSEKYILGDCKATYEVLIKYFETLVSKFPIDPLKVYSAPSAAFRIWRTVQLPLLHQDGLNVFDISHTLDSELREGYCGGIVDVYRPHLQGKGFYYDVNSLYPTAMCKPMPVGIPILIPNLTVAQFLEGNFYGFLEATVTAPVNEYIGLLPIKYKGRLICPGGTFKGIFFSEELRFAIANGYTLLEITRAFEFREGRNTFLQLITQLNEMKITAQLNKQPTIRNLAKLLMNSMYGRFGMHPSLSQTNIYTEEQLENLAQQWLLLNRIDFGELSLVTTLLNQEWILENLGRQELIRALIDAGNNTNVAIASAVTAHSRMIINQYKLEALKLGRKLYYSDTDSLVLDGPLPEEYLDSAILGKLKLEHVIKEGIFVMPKVYYLETEEGIEVTKCKGFPGKLSKAQYLALLSGETQHLQVTKWIRSLKETEIQILRNQPYSLKFLFNKRKRVFNTQGQWINTSPLILKP